MKSKAQGQPASLPLVVRSPGRLVRLEKSQAEIALRVLHTEVHNQLMDRLKEFKDRLDSKGLPSSRGDNIYSYIQSQVYTGFGLTQKQRKALKGDSKAPLLDFFTIPQIMAIYEVKRRMIGIYETDAENDVPRDQTNEKVNKAIKVGVEYHGKVFGK